MPCEIIVPTSWVLTVTALFGSRIFRRITLTGRLVDKHDVELWDGGRLVAVLSPSGEGASPGLVPSLPFDWAKNSVKPAEPISLSKVSEIASAASSEGNPFVPPADQATT
jgi:hypothetical protein